MRILQAGLAKSGNYWLYKILQSALRRSNLPTTTYIETDPIYPLAKTWELSYQEQADTDVLDIENTGLFYRVSSIYRMPIRDFDAYLARATHVWTHSLFCQRSYEVFPKFDKVVYIIRDPRDVVLSMVRFQFTPYMQAYYPVEFKTPADYLNAAFRKSMQRWQQHVSDYLRHAAELNIHIVFYERILADFDGELRALLTYLGLDPTPELMNSIKTDVSFETMQSANPGHVRQGKANRWMQELSEAQQTIAVKQIGKLLELLNYPTAADSQSIPVLPADLDSTTIAAATAPPLPTVKQRVKTLVRRLI